MFQQVVERLSQSLLGMVDRFPPREAGREPLALELGLCWASAGAEPAKLGTG